MATPLPPLNSLLDAMDALERQLDALTIGRAALRFEAQTSDRRVVAVADGAGRLVNLVLAPELWTSPPAVPLADVVRPVINTALEAAYADAARAVAALAPGMALPGLPRQGQPAPDFEGFRTTASLLSSKILARNPCQSTVTFRCSAGPVSAEVDARRRVLVLTYPALLPELPEHLAASTVAAVNCAIDEGSERPDDTVATVDDIVGASSPFAGLVLYAAGNLRIADRGVTIADAAGTGYGRIANAGPGETIIGAHAHVGPVLSRPKVTVRSSGHVHGELRTSDVLETQDNPDVPGPVTEHAVLALPSLALSVAFTGTPAPAVNVDSKGSKSASPGYYDGFNVNSGGRLALSSGVYRCNRLSIQKDAIVSLDTRSGPILLYVRDTCTLGGLFEPTDGSFPRLLVASFSSNDVAVLAPYRGTILAPRGHITLATVGSAGHTGTFAAKDIDVAADVRVRHRPFELPYDQLPGAVFG